MSEKEKFGPNHTVITLPNGARGIMDNQEYVLEQIAQGVWVEWFHGKRVSVLDDHMRDLPKDEVQKIIERLEKYDEQKSLCV